MCSKHLRITRQRLSRQRGILFREPNKHTLAEMQIFKDGQFKCAVALERQWRKLGIVGKRKLAGETSQQGADEKSSQHFKDREAQKTPQKQYRN